MDLQARITINPAVRFGKPCVRGTRLTVGDVLGSLRARRAGCGTNLGRPAHIPRSYVCLDCLALTLR